MSTISFANIIAELISRYHFSQSNTHIITDPSPEVDHDYELIDIEETIPDKETTIFLQNKGKFFEDFFDKTAPAPLDQKLGLILEEERNHIRLYAAREKQKYFTNNTATNLEFLNIEESLTDFQRSALEYYIPFKDILNSHLTIFSSCLKWIIKEIVQIELREPRRNQFPRTEETILDHWILSDIATIHGDYYSELSCLEIKIKIKSLDKLDDLLPSGSLFQFLNNWFCPMVLNGHYDWNLEIELINEKGKWYISTGKDSSYLGIDTLLSE